MLTLFETLEGEFCPPLDSSLLAALLAEIESGSDGKPLSPSAPKVEGLRDTLRELAAHADEAQLSELSNIQMIPATDGSVSSQDFGFSRTTGNTSISSGSSSQSSTHSFSSPLGFLQAALPDAPIETLKKALNDAERDGKALDMWDIVGNILSAESIRELAERGLDGLDELDGVFREDEIEWETVMPSSRKMDRPLPTKKPKRGRSTKITLVDIRQQNHAKPQGPGSLRKTPVPDPWTQVSSIATHVATYLPSHPLSFFLSYLHSPEYETPYKALCAALEAIRNFDSSHIPDEHSGILLNLLDVLLAEYEPLNSEEHSRLVYETELCLCATNGRGDDAIDVIRLLRELSSDATSGQWEMGIYHLPALKFPHAPTTPTSKPGKRSSLPAVLPPAHQVPPKPLPRRPTIPKPDQYQWHTIPVRKKTNNDPHPLAQNIPAYARAAVEGPEAQSSGNGIKELSHIQRRIKEHRRKQEEFLRQAAKMWQRGDKKSHGGEIAYYYAEKAREFQELAKQEALENARLMVRSKRTSTGKYDTIDLHGTTVPEALVIVNEILQESQCSPDRPLKIITGRGSHSMNKVAILKPAVKNALLEDGWTVGTWDGGLVVRGKNH